MSAPAPSQNQKLEPTFLGHPIGLYVLFFTEMWERFSYYGMRALLILYMVNYFRMAPKDASTVYKVYTSFVYVTPILGGFLADRYLGNRMAVIIGAVLMAFGHFMMAFEDRTVFYIALGLLIFGNGFFKPNMSVQVGRLYATNDNRRDGAYTIFYMGINLGAFLAPLICGWLQTNTVGEYHSGFSMAGIGMVLGLIIYLLGQPFLREIKPETTPTASNPVESLPEVSKESQDLIGDVPISEAKAGQSPSIFGSASILFPVLAALIGIVLTIAGPLVWLKGYLDWSDAVMLPIAGISGLLISMIGFDIQGALRDRVISIVVLGLFIIFFWGAFEQAGNVQNLWADQWTNRFLTKPMEEPGLFKQVEAKPSIPGAVEESPKPTIQNQFIGFFKNFLAQFELKKKNEPAQGWVQWFEGNLNPMPTTWFQAVNAAAIVFFAPIFAWLWLSLDRRGIKLSIPIKMVLGIVMASASIFMMMQAANQQNVSTQVEWKGKLPEGIGTNEKNQVGFLEEGGKFTPFQAGQLVLDPREGKLAMTGVLPNSEAFRMIASGSPSQFKHQIKLLKQASSWIGSTRQKAREQMDGLKTKLEEKLASSSATDAKQIQEDLDQLGKLVVNYQSVAGEDQVVSVGIGIPNLPEGFDMKYSELDKSSIEFLPAKILVARKTMTEKEVTGLQVAGSVPGFRKTVEQLFLQSSHWRVSPWWLIWSYILATFGELCISPVGLSMVSKLAPVKYATMLMGIWLLTNSFGNFLAGLMGEILWGTIPPADFFLFISSILLGIALILLAIVYWVVRAMHGVR